MSARRSLRGVVGWTLTLLVVAAGLTACGEGSPSDSKSEGGDMRIILVSHSPSTDPYWAVAAKGLEQAGKDYGVTTEYRGVKANLQDPNEQRRLIEAAIASKPDGLIITDPYPDSLNPVIKKAVDSGIPVVLINHGVGETEATGALTVVANDENHAGVVGGQLMKDAGAQHPLVVTTPPGAIPLVDDRANGFAEGFGSDVEQVQIPTNELNNAAFIKNAVEAKVSANKSIDAVFSTGSAFSPALLEVQNDLGDRGSSMQWGSIDLGDAVTSALQNDKWTFALDQQQFSQPYLAVTALVLYERYGIAPATDFIPTGPGVITPENADRIAELQDQHVR